MIKVRIYFANETSQIAAPVFQTIEQAETFGSRMVGKTHELHGEVVDFKVGDGR